ncbi:unnamed protein product, partial [Mycena citricolor]
MLDINRSASLDPKALAEACPEQKLFTQKVGSLFTVAEYCKAKSSLFYVPSTYSRGIVDLFPARGFRDWYMSCYRSDPVNF